MAVLFPSNEWIQEFSKQLNESKTYEQAGKEWEGDFLFFVEADPAFTSTVRFYLDLFHGKSPKSKLLAEGETASAKYSLSAPYSTWKKVIEGKLDPIQGLMTRKLKLQGDLMQIMRYPKAAKEMVSCCSRIPTEFKS